LAFKFFWAGDEPQIVKRRLSDYTNFLLCGSFMGIGQGKSEIYFFWFGVDVNYRVNLSRIEKKHRA